MESGAIPDSWISASSEIVWQYLDHQARLNFKASGGKAGSWAALYNNNNQWLQVDLQQTTRVSRIATQGRNGYPQWVTEYKLQYGADGQTFTFYRRKEDHSDTVCRNCSEKTFCACMISNKLFTPKLACSRLSVAGGERKKRASEEKRGGD